MMKPNKIRQRVRSSLMAKVDQVDFAMMTSEAYGKWIDALPPAEFVALLDLHSEWLAKERAEAEIRVSEPEEDDNPWTPLDVHEMPVAGDAKVYVLYKDDEVGGPNRADAFVWDPTDIIGYALADATHPGG